MNEYSYKVFKKLEEKKLKISAAESCTGGLFTKLITDIPGSSSVFELGIVTYANEAKVKYLGVNPKTIEEHGVVSCEVAMQMSEGIKNAFGADIGIGITGIAGPGGGNKFKPVGLVWTCIFYNGKYYPKKLLLDGTREEIRLKTCEEVFINILNIID